MQLLSVCTRRFCVKILFEGERGDIKVKRIRAWWRVMSVVSIKARACLMFGCRPSGCKHSRSTAALRVLSRCCPEMPRLQSHVPIGEVLVLPHLVVCRRVAHTA